MSAGDAAWRPALLLAGGGREGVVAGFDEAGGLGVVSAPGIAELSFHCTAIADGTRTIGVGERVVFEIVAAHRGQLEAASILKLG